MAAMAVIMSSGVETSPTFSNFARNDKKAALVTSAVEKINAIARWHFGAYLSRVKNLGVAVLFAVSALAARTSFAGDYNSLVLDQIKQMPQGGHYSVSHFAKIRLQSSAHFESGKFFILPSQASPSFCSGATYLVFIRTIEALRARRIPLVVHAT